MEIAKSGRNGLEAYKANLAKGLLPHILFIDIEMPDMDGLEVTKIVRSVEKEYNFPRIFICGLITEETNRFDLYHEIGMDEFLKKPVNIQLLNDLIDRRLSMIQESNAPKKEIPLEKTEIEKLLNFQPEFPLKLKEKTTFLTIDDNDFILIGISHIRLPIPYKMDICKSGIKGLALYKSLLQNREQYHAIFIDIDMPEMDGLQVAQAIRRIETAYNIPNTFLCGLITEDNKDFDRYMEAGMNEILKKPVNPNSMALILQKLPSNNKNVAITKEKEEEKDSLMLKKPVLALECNYKEQITFLAVDDNDFILMAISHLKLDFPYRMDICKSGILAIEKYTAMRKTGFLYHAIFMDIEMPVMNGLECTIKIRGLEKELLDKKTVIIGLINEDNKDIESYLDSGMNEFINKPVNPKTMNILVSKLLKDLTKPSITPINHPPASEIPSIIPYTLPNIVTLLAVDDNDFILMGLSHLRVDFQYKMDVCKNGKLAIERYCKLLDSHLLYHAIFMDIDMPEMNGLQACRKLREIEKTKNIPRTFIIGLINDDYKDIEGYLEAGMDEFLNKPVNPKAFASLIKKQLEIAENLSKKDNKSNNNLKKDEEIQQELQKALLIYPPELNLLAVDDNDFILMGLSHLKVDYKYRMEISKLAKQAFIKYKAFVQKGFQYHAIFIDIDMPEISGLELTTMIRAYEAHNKINPISFIVGLITEDNKEVDRYIESGMNEFINKPVHPKAMNELLKRFIVKKEEIILQEAVKGEIVKELGFNKELLMLAVDDNDFILIGISHLKLKAKYKMENSRSGINAFDKYKAMISKGLLYHCIFIDIEMPVMGGVELTMKIRDYEKEQGYKERTLICGLITEDTNDIEKYKEAGMDDFLKKPVYPNPMNKFLEDYKLI